MQWFLNLAIYLNHLQSLSHRFLGQHMVSDSAGLTWGLRICISHKFPGEAHVCPGTTLENNWPNVLIISERVGGRLKHIYKLNNKKRTVKGSLGKGGGQLA